MWEQKTAYQRKGDQTPEDFYERAGIWAEFGKIVCISVGFFDTSTPNSKQLRIKSFAGEEENILKQFKQLCDEHFYLKSHLLCAHNGKEFDFPYIARRMVIHRINLPKILNLFGKKPWEVQHLDTLQLWKFGDYKHYTSLALLAEIFGIPTPKDDIDGSDVAHVYYQEKNLDRPSGFHRDPNRSVISSSLHHALILGSKSRASPTGAKAETMSETGAVTAFASPASSH